MKASHASILMLLIAGLAGSTAGLADNEGSADNDNLLHGTWSVLQCVKFETDIPCANPNHLLAKDMVRVMPLFGNTGIVSVVSLKTEEIFLFSGYNLERGTRKLDLQVSEGSTQQVELPYLSIEFWDEGRGDASPKEKRLELHLIKGGDAPGQPAACRAALSKLSKDRLSDDLGNKETVCDPEGSPRVFWSICTIDRSDASCKRKAGEVGILSPPDDGMGTGGSGDSGVPITDDEGAA